MTSIESATASDDISSPRDSALRFNNDFLRRYLDVAPAALAVERSFECEILSTLRFERPVLDVGCGDGVFAAILCADRIDTGIDLDRAEIERAKGYGRYDELIVCSGAAIPKPDASYRTIFSNSVLEHIADLLPVLREQHRLLAPGGRFFVTVPTDRWEKASVPARLLAAVGLRANAERYARFYNRFWRHYHAYSEKRWIALFHQAGFEVVEQRSYAPADITTMLDALTVVAAPAIVSKKVLGRWIMVPPLRRAMGPLTHAVAKGLARACGREGGGNLVFFALTRRTDA